MTSEKVRKILEKHDESLFTEKAFTPESMGWQPLPLHDPDMMSVMDSATKTYLRENDWVVGFHYKGIDICVPNLIIRLTHAVTFTINSEESVVLFHCEVCSYSAAYVSNRKFLAGAIYGFGMCACDCDSGEFFAPIPGVFISGKSRGKTLELVPNSQCSFSEWKKCFPNSQVVTWFDPSVTAYPDGSAMPLESIRVRHGASDVFSQPDNRPHFFKSSVIPEIASECACTPENNESGKKEDEIDDSNNILLSFSKNLEHCETENAMVLLLNSESAMKFLSVEALKERKGVVNAVCDDHRIVIVSYAEDSALCAVFVVPEAIGSLFPSHSRMNGNLKGDDCIAFDNLTGSKWGIDGTCISGPLAGTTLSRFPMILSKYHSYISWHEPPSQHIEIVDRNVAIDGKKSMINVPSNLNEIAKCVDAQLVTMDYNISLPSCAEAGGTIMTKEGDLFQVYIYRDEAAAVDASHPLAAALTEVQLMTSPEVRLTHKDITSFYGFHEYGLVCGRVSITPRPPVKDLFKNQMIGTKKEMEQIHFNRSLKNNIGLRNKWSAALMKCSTYKSSGNHISATQLLRECKKFGLNVSKISAVSPGIAPPDCLSVVLTLMGDQDDQFLVYRFKTPKVAHQYSAICGASSHAVLIDSFIFRSVPFLLGGLVEPGKERIEYSKLVLSKEERKALIKRVLTAKDSLF